MMKYKQKYILTHEKISELMIMAHITGKIRTEIRTGRWGKQGGGVEARIMAYLDSHGVYDDDDDPIWVEVCIDPAKGIINLSDFYEGSGTSYPFMKVSGYTGNAPNMEIVPPSGLAVMFDSDERERVIEYKGGGIRICIHIDIVTLMVLVTIDEHKRVTEEETKDEA